MEHVLDVLIEFHRDTDGQTFDLHAGEKVLKGSFTPPFTASQFDEFRNQQGPLEGCSHFDLGERLFTALLKDESLQAYREIRDLAWKKNRPFRLSLKFCGNHKALLNLPWEIMVDNSNGKYLTMQHSVVRYLEVEKPPRAPKVVKSLNVLAVFPNPNTTNMAKIDTKAFISKMKKTLPTSCELMFPEEPTIASVCTYLKNHPDVHVLHVTCHGKIIKEWGMAFEKGGALHHVTSYEQRQVLKLPDSLRLINLVSCGLASSEVCLDPAGFFGIPHALVADGVPAVVAMTSEIGMAEAMDFMEAFYHHLDVDFLIDRALQAGRDTLWDYSHTHFSLPVLFMRDLSERLWLPEPATRLLIDCRKPSWSTPASASATSVLELHPFFKHQLSGAPVLRSPKAYAWRQIRDQLSFRAENIVAAIGLLGCDLPSISFLTGLAFHEVPAVFATDSRDVLDEAICLEAVTSFNAWQTSWSETAATGDLRLSIEFDEGDLAQAVQDLSLASERLSTLPWLRIRATKQPVDNGEAAAAAKELARLIRDEIRPNRQIHLFLALPGPIAVLLATQLSDYLFVLYEYEQGECFKIIDLSQRARGR